MRKLGGIEKVDDFILAIASGADVNGSWRGVPLVEKLFDDLLRLLTVYPFDEERGKKSRDQLLKFQALIGAGADVSILFAKEERLCAAPKVDRIVNMLYSDRQLLALLQVVMDCVQARDIIAKDEYFRKDMAKLCETLQALNSLVAQMRLQDEKQSHRDMV